MPGRPNKAQNALPAPVITAVLAIILTRLFNLLMFIQQPEGVPRDGVFEELSSLPGYILLFSVLMVLLITELLSAGLLLSGRRSGRSIFTACQCLVLLIAGIIFGWHGLEIAEGVDVADISQLRNHLLLQKIPDMVILLMLYLPASSRHYFRRKP
ncbi:YbjO family protein [Tatumella citrea]|uniref:DUF2593 domain-containing protein n=1 Tax=Tatumella citrea TaxID=53336 RepID=A0A1Y0LIN8_TATCI|nr:YbjO family protein [Tatumella citrea]ARU93490.1 hypothetical protein A7K98_06660 [Tatumella citrea]ARU97529.1 hypothetical protein A7K99_06660 [Tatumella citrea]